MLELQLRSAGADRAIQIEVGQRHRCDRLFLRPHDAFERCVSRFAERERRRQQGGQRSANDLKTAVGLALDAQRISFDFNFARVGDAGEVQILGERARDGAGAAVVGQSSDDEQIEAGFLQRPRHRVRGCPHVASF